MSKFFAPKVVALGDIEMGIRPDIMDALNPVIHPVINPDKTRQDLRGLVKAAMSDKEFVDFVQDLFVEMGIHPDKPDWQSIVKAAMSDKAFLDCYSKVKKSAPLPMVALAPCHYELDTQWKSWFLGSAPHHDLDHTSPSSR